MILQVLQNYASLFALQNYASPDLYTKIHSSLSILLGLRHLPCNMKHLGKRPSQSSAIRAKWAKVSFLNGLALRGRWRRPKLLYSFAIRT